MSDFKKCSILEDVDVIYISTSTKADPNKNKLRAFSDYDGNFNLIEYTCPSCRERLCGKHERANFCPSCGQPITWD